MGQFFKYAGRVFTPADIKRNGDLSFGELADIIRNFGVFMVTDKYRDAYPRYREFEGGWSYEGFYDAAKKKGCGSYDVFVTGGALCVPCGWCLWKENK